MKHTYVEQTRTVLIIQIGTHYANRYTLYKCVHIIQMRTGKQLLHDFYTNLVLAGADYTNWCRLYKLVPIIQTGADYANRYTLRKSVLITYATRAD